MPTSSFRLSRIPPDEFAPAHQLGTIELNPTLGEWRFHSPPTIFSAALGKTAAIAKLDDALIEIGEDAVHFRADVARGSGTAAVAELSLLSRLKSGPPDRYSQNFSHSAGLHFCISSVRSARYWMTLEFEGLEPSGAPTLFEANFDAGPSLREVRLGWSAFRRLGSAHNTIMDVARITGALAGARNLCIRTLQRTGETVEFTLHGPIEVDRELKTLEPEDGAVLRWLRSIDPVRLSGYGPALGDLPLRLGHNLSDLARQQRAIAAVRSGTLIADLRARGFDFHLLHDRRPGDGAFFKTMHDGMRAMIPIELGAFGADHGELSHAVQLWAMLDGLDSEHTGRVHTLFARMQASLNAWSVWNILFDSNRGINSPRYWRDVLSDMPQTAALLNALQRSA